MRNLGGKAAIVGLAWGVLLAAAPALAADCKETKRNDTMTSIKGVAVHTVVHNRSKSRSYDVAISRGSTEKTNETVAPGTQVGKLSGVIDEGTINISIKPAGGSDETLCSYQVEIQGPDSYWRPALSGGDLCSGGIVVYCSKSFHPGKLRWNTTLQIID